ncbi:MAG TPA: DedA family protein [Gammaproteobacteria bacterium]|nr:DedA family protein [Gammaproteobacteria bacterium]
MIEFITRMIDTGGYPGIVLLMFLENVFPPLPSEIIVPFAGYAAAQGKLTLIGVVVSGTIGSVAGTFMWYGVARLFGEARLRRMVDKYGRWITIDQDEVTRAKSWFERYGNWAVFFGRLIPAIRTLISIPAGLACMPPLRFLTYTLLGSLLWVSVLTWLGVMLDKHYQLVDQFLAPVTDVIIAAIVIAYIWRVVRYKRSR